MMSQEASHNRKRISLDPPSAKIGPLDPPTLSMSEEDTLSVMRGYDQRHQRPLAEVVSPRSSSDKWDNFWRYYVWQILAFMTIGMQITAIAMEPTSPAVIVMAVIAIPVCIQVIVRRYKVKQWNVLYKEYRHHHEERAREAQTLKKSKATYKGMERKELRLLRKEKKLKKILRKNKEKTTAHEKKLTRLVKQHKRQVERQRDYINKELQYQALSAHLSIQKHQSKAETKRKRKSKFYSGQDNKEKAETPKQKEKRMQQMNYFVEMMSSFSYIAFDKKAFENLYDPIQALILPDIHNTMVSLPQDEALWYEHSNALYTRLMASPYSSHKSGKQIILTKEEEAVASRFRKMLNLGVPKEAARTKMQIENAGPKIIAAVLDEEFVEEDEEEEDEATKKKKKRGKAVFHWEPVSFKEEEDEDAAKSKRKGKKHGASKKVVEEDPLSNSQRINRAELLEKSIWAKTQQKLSNEQGSDQDQVISKIIGKYMKQQAAAGGGEDEDEIAAKREKASKKKDKAGILDLNRARNIDITLKSFSSFTHDELAKIINLVDPKEELKGDRLLLLTQLVPTPSEAQALKEYKGEEYRLVQAEKWFRAVANVKRIEDKTTAIKTVGTFQDIVSFLNVNFTILASACQQVLQSQKLQDLLAMVLKIGNEMNESPETVEGFNLDFLTQMSYTKGTDKTTTAVDLLVTIFVNCNKRESLMLKDDIPDCTLASDIQISTLIADFGLLEAALKQCEQELEALKKENTSAPKSAGRKFGGGGGSIGKKFGMNQEMLAAQLGRIHGNKAAGGEENTPPPAPKPPAGGGGMFDMHKELLAKKLGKINGAKGPPGAGVPAKAATETSTKKSSAGGIGGDLEPSIRRLENFLKEAKVTIKELQEKREQAKKACCDLSDFFCESSGENSANSLLSILDGFCNNLEQSLKKSDERAGIAEKKKKTTEKAKSKVKKAVADLHNNLRVFSMLKSLRTDAENRGWEVVRDKYKKDKKPSKARQRRSDVTPDMKGWGRLANQVAARSVSRSKSHHPNSSTKRSSAAKPRRSESIDPEGSHIKVAGLRQANSFAKRIPKHTL